MDYRFSDHIAGMKPSAIREILKAPADAETISFAAGNPSPESFPVSELARLSADIFEHQSTLALQYGATDGYPPLRAAVAKWQKERWQIGKFADEGYAFNDTTLIVSGGTQGIELACRVLCNPGEAVICEDPSFIGALNAFRSAGMRTVGVPMNNCGIDVDALEQTIIANPDAHLLYVIPTFQNPMGLSWTPEVREKVYALAKKYGILILEDNPYGETRFAGKELPTLKSMDEDGIVIYCSTFSKVLSAGMRVGFVVAPEQIASKMVIVKQTEDVHTNLFFQMLCHRYITECDLYAHIDHIKDIYRRKCTLMLDCLARELPDAISYTKPEGGLFIWCTLPDGIDSMEFVRACKAKKLLVVPGATFNCDQDAPSNGFRINFSTPSDEQIVEGCARLGAVAREFLQ